VNIEQQLQELRREVAHLRSQQMLLFYALIVTLLAVCVAMLIVQGVRWII
jgi:hypothetical protein